MWVKKRNPEGPHTVHKQQPKQKHKQNRRQFMTLHKTLTKKKDFQMQRVNPLKLIAFPVGFWGRGTSTKTHKLTTNTTSDRQ